MSTNKCRYCERNVYARGMCTLHWSRVRRTGNPSVKFSRGSLEEKLDSRTDRRAPHECWPWLGTMRGSYGVMKHEGKDVAAHRLVFYRYNDYFPEVVRHTCDTPECVNPAHLLPGNQQDNVNDRVERGRSAISPGRSNPNARYTEEELDEVRTLRRRGLTYDEIAKLTNVHRSTIARVCRGQK